MTDREDRPAPGADPMADETARPEITDGPQDQEVEVPPQCAVIPLRDLVIFPYLVVPISVGRQASVLALEEALEKERKVVLVTQRSPNVENPMPEDLFEIGTLSVILRMARLESEVRILAQGLARVKLSDWIHTDPYLKAKLTEMKEAEVEGVTIDALMKTVVEQFKKLASMSKNISPEMVTAADRITAPGMLADMVTTNLDITTFEKQDVLEIVGPEERLKKVVNLLVKEVEVLSVSTRIQDKAQQELSKAHREFILREQLKAIQGELGEGDERSQEIEEYKKKIADAKMPEDADKKALHELDRLRRMHPDSAESGVVRTYLDTLIALPWNIASQDDLDIGNAKQILDDDHYGLTQVKERLLEYLSVKKLKHDMKGPILCLAGPPGVGKTSLGRSVASALGRKFVRMSLGGVRDEAEIRGHRRTYVGAMPGRVIQGIRSAGTNNPVFILDEIDKVGMDFRGDPTSALLEVLDPEQNSTFSDHYLELPFDLSNVLFIATANMLDPIPAPLRDRMEVIELSSYTLPEKVEIARRHLIPKQLENHGLLGRDVKVGPKAIGRVIEEWTREAGVRNLERNIASLFRKVAYRKALGEAGPFVVNEKNLEEYLGVPRFPEKEFEKKRQVGVATGLAWTSVGGTILQVEATMMEGRGKLMLTGQLGSVMQESAQAALSWIRANAERLGIDPQQFQKKDIHVHCPAGATPKDGPSAGVTMATALTSLLTNRPVDKEVAMTGEINLRGDVLPIGGLKEKLLAAGRGRLHTAIIPKDNELNLVEVDQAVKEQMKIYPVTRIEDVLVIALGLKDFAELAPAANKSAKQRAKVEPIITRKLVKPAESSKNGVSNSGKAPSKAVVPAKPAAKPAPKPAAKPAPKPAAQPAAKAPVPAKPAVKAAAPAKPAAKPATKAVTPAPAAEPAKPLSQKPTKTAPKRPIKASERKKAVSKPAVKAVK
ncbi:MAG: endopeptidase La [bacterium]